MAVRESGKEQLIKDTAKHIFFTEGKLHATTQDIADAAGVNRSLVHYYYRSRDFLFEQVFKEATDEMRATLDKVLISDLPFKLKIEKFIDEFLTQATKYPYRELYLVSEINRNDFDIDFDKKDHPMKLFIRDIQKEMDDGILKPMDPRQFIINLFSLMVYPLLAGSLNKKYFNLNDKEYLKIMEQRKKIIFDVIYS